MQTRLVPMTLRNRHLVVLDAFFSLIATSLAFAIRFESFEWIVLNVGMVAAYAAFSIVFKLAVFYTAGMYRRLWRHASIGELRLIVLAACASALISLWIGRWLLPTTQLTQLAVPYSVLITDAILGICAAAFPRLLARTIRQGPSTRRRRTDSNKPVLIIGAGDAAKQVVKEITASPSLGFEPIGFLDDDSSKHGQYLLGLPILGAISEISTIVERMEVAELIIAMPSAPGPIIRQVVRAALDAAIPTLTVPSLPEIIARNGQSGLREVQIQDLLRRDPIETDMAAVAALVTGETVLITGAGGSIGSELCRQIARLAPRKLVLLGHGENSIFDVTEELVKDFPDISIVPVIADVRNRDRMMQIVDLYRPKTLFHAAAHKHVPLMENNLIEAITNNIVGTRNVVDAALVADVEHFVLISTDKAVRPTSIMGVTKRVAEMIVQLAASRHERNFVSVRFGNVLGSRGSVVPTFMRQIRAGGPVTVTHPEMQRFFMTIPEAVQLVLQAGALGRGGEVFLLDMGEPIRILDIATDLIRLSGLTVGTDIEIKFTGMRPGEKLYEEMFFSAENIIPTEHPKVLRARSGILADGIGKRIDTLMRLAESSESDDKIRELLIGLVPDFHIQRQPPIDAATHRSTAFRRA